MRFTTHLVIRLLAIGVLSTVVPPLSAQEADGVASAPPAASAFEPIRRDFNNLYRSLRSQGAIDDEARGRLRDLHGRVLAFREAWPDDVAALAADFQLSLWLDDEDRAADLRAMLIEAMPDNVDLQSAEAEDLRSQNRYGEAIRAIESAGIDLQENPQVAVLMVRCLFAEERFQEALDLLNSLTEETLKKNAAANSQAQSLRPTLEAYVKFWDEELDVRRAETEDDDLPRAEILTENGRIVVELFENDAPNSVANFISLAEQGYYDGTKFHRVLSNFMAQGGCPNTKEGATGNPGEGNPGYFIPDEHSQTSRRHFTGSLSMANSGRPNSGGSQFFLTHEPTFWLNGKHTVFGRVLEGEDVVRAIEPDDQLVMIRMLRKREHPYEPDTVAVPAPIPPIPDPGTILTPEGTVVEPD